jgi:hypothetical protein
MGYRPMAGHAALDRIIGVRIPVPQIVFSQMKQYKETSNCSKFRRVLTTLRRPKTRPRVSKKILKRKFPYIIFIALIFACQRPYPLRFSTDGVSWMKVLEYDEDNKKISVRGELYPQTTPEHLFIKIEYEVQDTQQFDISEHDIDIISNYDMDKRIDIRQDLKAIVVFLWMYHPDFRKTTKEAMLEFLRSKYIIINIGAIFENDLSVYVRIDESKIKH